MKEYGIPGLAVGIVTPEGEEVFTFGVASKATQQPVTADTLFEIGSVSKTFTATLASYAAVKGDLALTDPVTRYLPELGGSALGRVTLLNLATHTTGGMPLQFPDAVTNDAQMMDYYRNWTPAEAPGSSRTYSNPSIGLLGLVTANAMKADFADLMEGTLYPALGMKHTYLDVPKAERTNYAQGYTKQDAPIRMASGVLADEAYGVRTTVADLTRFVEANMGRVRLDADVAKAIAGTHVSYYKLGAMMQAMVWEQYDYPAKLDDLLAGNSAEVAYKPKAVTPVAPPAAPRADTWINKTGSTNGFGAYVAFVPGRKVGIVILANKNYPIDARVTAAYEILTKLDRDSRSTR
jgi:beta-lactamase class C